MIRQTNLTQSSNISVIEFIPPFEYLIDFCNQFYLNNKLMVEEINLSGSRHSGKTRQVINFLILMLLSATKYDKTINIICFRKMNTDVMQLFQEVKNQLLRLDILDDFIITLNGGYRPTITFKSKVGNYSKIEVRAVNTTSRDKIPLKGHAAYVKSNLIIVFIEEANEFELRDINAISAAIRGEGDEYNTPKLVVTCCNAENPYQYYVRYLNERLPFNLETMKTKNFQFKVIRENEKLKIFHYLNWRMNPKVPKANVLDMLELEKRDPYLAQTWSYGSLGSIYDSVFSRYVDVAETKLTFTPVYFSGGVDLGAGDAMNAHPTTAIFCVWNRERDKVHAEAQYYHSNAISYKSRTQVLNEVVSFYLECYLNWCNNNEKWTIYVDFGGLGNFAIDKLNDILHYRAITYIEFAPVNKNKMLVIPRIDHTILLITKKIISFNWNNCPYLKRDLTLMRYRKPATENASYEVQLVPLDDDSWDALIYSLLEWSDYLINSKNISKND